MAHYEYSTLLVAICSLLLFLSCSSQSCVQTDAGTQQCIELTPSSIPIIDISPLYGNDREAMIDTSQKIGRACKEIGFFVIVNHGVDPRIISDVWNATAEFFELPTEEKLKYTPESQADYPYGYNRMGGEVLSAGKVRPQLIN